MYKNIVASWSIEFGPIIIFFLALHFLGNTDKGFITSTGIFTLLTFVALISSYVYEKRIALFPLIAGLSVIFFGLLTLIFNNPIIFIVKDTIYNGFFGIFLLWGVIYRKGLLKPLFIALFDITDKGWYILSLRWGIFFLLLAAGNEFFYHMYGRDAWVAYKFWSTIITVVFGFYQITLSRRHKNEGASSWGLRTVLFHSKD